MPDSLSLTPPLHIVVEHCDPASVGPQPFRRLGLYLPGRFCGWLLFGPVSRTLAGMTIFETIDQALKFRGWRYDRGDGQFMDGRRVLTWEDIVGLVPGVTLDELAAYQDTSNMTGKAVRLARELNPMGADQATRIESCVLACCDHCRKSNRPFTRLSAFLESLKLHGWTDEEIIEVQTIVNRELRDEHNSDGDISDRSNR